MKKIAASHRLYGFIIILLSLLAYSNSFTNSLQFDDYHVIIKNHYIRDIQNVPRFFWTPEMGSGLVKETSGYRPVLMATFALNYYLGGLQVFGYHLFNLLIHSLSAILVYFIALAFLTMNGNEMNPGRGHKVAALFSALVFALHPVQTESVTYITGRSSSLAAFFYLASFLAFIRFRLKRRPRSLALSALCFILALSVKETAFTFLLAIALFEALFVSGLSWRRRLFPYLPLGIISAAYLLARWHFLGPVQYQAGSIRPLYEQILTQSRAWVHYLQITLLPVNLNVDYDFPLSHSLGEWPVIRSLLILAGLSWTAWKVSQKSRPAGFFALWFAIHLLPTNSLVRLEDIVTDRWLYLPLVGYAVLCGLLAEWVFRTRVRPAGRPAAWVFFFLCALVLELYGMATVLRNFTWTTDWTLWEDAVAKSPNKPRPHINLGLALTWAGRIDEGIGEFKRAIELNPRNSLAYLNLGFALTQQGRTAEAIESYQKAMALSPYTLSESHNNLGLAFFREGRKEEGLRELEKAIQIRPNNANPYYNLGNFYEEEGDTDRAISYFETAARLEPEFFSVHLALSRAYEKKGWKEKSQQAYRNFLHYAPSGKNGSPAGG